MAKKIGHEEMNQPAKIADFLDRHIRTLVFTIVLIFSLLIFFLVYGLSWRSYRERELMRVKQIEVNWAGAIDSFGKILCVLSEQTGSFQDEETIRKVLKKIHDLYSPLVAYPAFGRSDGKMISYPQYEYPAEYDPRKRVWYQAALVDPDSYAVVKPFMHAILNEPTIAVAKAVRDENGNVLGVLGLDLVGSRLAANLLVEGSYIVDETGQIIAKKGIVKAVFDPKSADRRITIRMSGVTHYIALPSVGGTYVVIEHNALEHALTALTLSLSMLTSLIVVNVLASRRLRKILQEKIVFPLEKIVKAVHDYLSKRQFEIEPIEEPVYEVKLLENELSDMVTIIEAQTEELEASYRELESSKSQLEEAYEALSQKEKEIKRAYQTLTEKLGLVVEKFDEPTGKHVVRVSKLSKFLAEKLNLPEALVQQIELYSPLHDIGKIFVPRDILIKPGRLTKEEFELVKAHVVKGAELFENDEKFTVARNIILYHHERYDGSGYPFGLKGDAIPIEAQIVGLVDVYDALRSERPYKKALSHEEALKVLLDGDEKTHPCQFAPRLLQTFAEHEKEIDELWKSCSCS